jgi:hypothetical protein
VYGLEQPPGMTGSRAVRCSGFRFPACHGPGVVRLGSGEGFGQAAAVGSGDFLNTPGQALPQVKAITHLQGIGGAVGDALPIGERAVATGDLNAGMLA